MMNLLLLEKMIVQTSGTIRIGRGRIWFECEPKTEAFRKLLLSLHLYIAISMRVADADANR